MCRLFPAGAGPDQRPPHIFLTRPVWNSTAGPMRVLVVEDETRMAALLKRGLEEESYAVDVASNGTDGLWLGMENSYDAIVLDVMLPGLNGFDVCRQLREKDRWAPILLLTARDAVEDRIRGLDAGADDYLAKPFAFGELLARLRALLRRGAHERPAVLTVGDLKLDPATRVVSRADEPVELTSKEYALLELLMRHPGEVLSRTRILEHVWDFAYDPASNVVDQYVAYLRRKLDKPYGKDDIETVRGAGYRLRASGSP
jgi:two-component system, OmpR family, response regulator